MRWTIETERKNDEFRLSLSLSHTHMRAISLRLFKENCVQRVKFCVNEARKGGKDRAVSFL